MNRLLPLLTALRPILVLMLALAVALVSSHTAVGRAEARGGIVIELCDGSLEGVTLLVVDARGKPMAPHAVCPDCVLSGLATLGALPALPPPVMAARRTDFMPPDHPVALRPLPLPVARGPPPRILA